MNSNEWGPRAWFLIHAIAFNYPEEPSKEDKQKFKNFIYSLGDVLPCKYCKPAFSKYLEDIPMEPYLKDRKGASYWSYLIHDRVNKKLGKKSPPYEEIVKVFEPLRSTCNEVKDKEDEEIENSNKTCGIQARDYIPINEVKKFNNETKDEYDGITKNMDKIKHNMTEKQHLKSLGIILFFIGTLYVMHKYSSKTKALKKVIII